MMSQLLYGLATIAVTILLIAAGIFIADRAMHKQH